MLLGTKEKYFPRRIMNDKRVLSEGLEKYPA